MGALEGSCCDGERSVRALGGDTKPLHALPTSPFQRINPLELLRLRVDDHVNLAVSASVDASLRPSLIPTRSYRGLSSRARLFVGLGVMAYAGFGLLLSDQAEKTFNMVPTEQDKERLNHAIPKIRVVDKDDVTVGRTR